VRVSEHSHGAVHNHHLHGCPSQIRINEGEPHQSLHHFVTFALDRRKCFNLISNRVFWLYSAHHFPGEIYIELYSATLMRLHTKPMVTPKPDYALKDVRNGVSFKCGTSLQSIRISK
jgi:hypothetical protein